MSVEASSKKGIGDGYHLKVLEYDDSFHRSMSLWANFALGFTYLSPLVGVYSQFALAMSTGGPPSLFWLFIVGTGFLASLINAPATKEVTLGLSIAFLVVAFGLNFSGTKTLARVARIGLAAELIGVVAVGLYLLIFQRHQEFSVFFDSMGVQGNGSYATAFLGAALTGLFLFYGFEACGEMAGHSVAAHRGADQCVDCGVLDSGDAMPDHLRWQRAGPDPDHPADACSRCTHPPGLGAGAGIRIMQAGPVRGRALPGEAVA